LAYQPGQRFDQRKLEQSRNNILNLNLFSAVEFTVGGQPKNSPVVPITIAVDEKSTHSLYLGLGYNTRNSISSACDGTRQTRFCPNLMTESRI
jgi:outer membrane protein assembly factor BamA